MNAKLLTETADYDTPGSWGKASNKWPEIKGDVAFVAYIHANKTGCIPYGSYVLMKERGQYGAKESCLRVHPDFYGALQKAMLDAATAATPTGQHHG